MVLDIAIKSGYCVLRKSLSALMAYAATEFPINTLEGTEALVSVGAAMHDASASVGVICVLADNFSRQ